MKSIREITYFTHNLSKMTEFYRRITEAEPVYTDSDISLFKLGNLKLLIHAIHDQGEGDLPFDDHIAFGVVDVDQTYRQLNEQGQVFERTPDTYSWGRSAYLRDPDGRMVEINVKS